MASHSLPSSGTRPPKYCRQVEKGRADRAYVRIDGKKYKLGVYGSPESQKRYAELIAGVKDEPQPKPTSDPTVTVLIARYLEFAETYYPVNTNVRRTSTYHDLIPVMRHVKKVAGPMRAREFGPKLLKQVRQSFIDAGQSRTTVNKNVRRVQRMFKWAASEEMIPGAIDHNLATVEGLRKGRSAARDSAPVQPVDDAIVDATIEHLTSVVADMVRIQRLTAMRSNEVCQLRPCDIDRSGEVWIFRPQTH